MKFIRKNGRIIPIKDKGESSSSNKQKEPKITKKEYLKASSEVFKKNAKDAPMSNRIALGAFGAMIGGSFGLVAGGITAGLTKSKHGGKMIAGGALIGATAMGALLGGKRKVMNSKEYDKKLTNKLNKIRKNKSSSV